MRTSPVRVIKIPWTKKQKKEVSIDGECIVYIEASQLEKTLHSLKLRLALDIELPPHLFSQNVLTADDVFVTTHIEEGQRLAVVSIL